MEIRSFTRSALLFAFAWSCGGETGDIRNSVANTGGYVAASGGSGNAGGAGAATLNLPFDPTEGCRDFSSPGCSQCCSPTVDFTGAISCNMKQLNVTSVQAGPCPGDCPACATCSTDAEQTLLSSPSRPDCDCRSVVIGIDPCFSPEGCGCLCYRLQHSLAQCPQLGSTTCRTAKNCNIQLVVKPGPYNPGDTINLYWVNFSSGTAHVNDCGNVGVWRLDRSTNTLFPVAATQPCSSPDAAMTLAPGEQSPAISVVVPTGAGGGHYILQGMYYIDCLTESVVGATCNPGTIEVQTSYEVYSE